ncbi:Protein DGCR6 [Aphelenchoides besseyi]|nr:Protein DGCR6 [Aphelenchoides besseyi]
MSDRRLILEERLRHFVSENPNLKTSSEFTDPDVQRRLLDSLVDGSVFSVVESLNHLQELKETELMSQRYSRVRELGEDVNDEQIHSIDKQIVDEIDTMVTEQQSNLCCAGVPLFRVTSDPGEIDVQIEIIKFIMTLHDVYE